MPRVVQAKPKSHLATFGAALSVVAYVFDAPIGALIANLSATLNSAGTASPTMTTAPYPPFSTISSSTVARVASAQKRPPVTVQAMPYQTSSLPDQRRILMV